MSMRTGYSLSYDFVNAQFHLNTSVAPPFNAEARVDNPAGGFDNPWLGTGNETFFPFTTGPNSVFPLTGPYISIPSDIRVPRQQSWNVSLQRQIGDNLAASATYLGSYSDRLWNVRSLNPGVYIPGACTLQTPTGPQNFNPCSTNATLNFRRVLTMQNFETGKYLGVVDEHTALGYQRYHGLLLSVQRRSVNGITASANYTLSKCMGLPTQGGTTPNVGTRLRRSRPNPDYDYGPCDTDRRHLFNMTLGVQTPDFENAWLHAIASDWTLSGIARFFSGRRLNVTLTSDPARTGIANQRPNLVLDNPYGDKSYTQLPESRRVRRAGAGHARQPAAQRHRRPWHQGGGPGARPPVPVRQPPDRGARRGVQRVQLVQPVHQPGDDQQLADRELEQRPVREDYRGRRPADHAVRDQVFVLTLEGSGCSRSGPAGRATRAARWSG